MSWRKISLVSWSPHSFFSGVLRSSINIFHVQRYNIIHDKQRYVHDRRSADWTKGARLSLLDVRFHKSLEDERSGCGRECDLAFSGRRTSILSNSSRALRSEVLLHSCRFSCSCLSDQQYALLVLDEQVHEVLDSSGIDSGNKNTK